MAKNGSSISAWVFDSFDFKWVYENELIKELLKWGEKKVFAWLFTSLKNTEKWTKIRWEIAKLKENFFIDKANWNLICALKIEQEINRISDEIRKILVKNWYSTKVWNKVYEADVVKDIVKNVSYRAFMFWVLKILESTGFDTNSKKLEDLTDVDDKLTNIIFKVIKDPRLTTLLIVLKSYWFIELSGNMINKYELEEEVKVCNIGKEKNSEIITKLETMWAIKTFEWTVEDFYYDYPDEANNLKDNSDSTFRLRKKVWISDWETESKTKRYYTIKRKLSNSEKQKLVKLWQLDNREVNTRICEEKEFEINNLNEFKWIIEAFWLEEQKLRRKKKDRVSYYHPWKQEWSQWMKFDFDKYNKTDRHKSKQLMLELEASKGEKITPWLIEFWIQNKKDYPQMATWSTRFLTAKLTDECSDDYLEKNVA